MTKKNLPNIPIYIGDWLKDCNSLSMQAQGAWLQIIFKLWTKGKQNSIKMRTKSIQKLWRCSEIEMLEIIEEFIEEDICPVVRIEENGVVYYEITCRRFVKENELSEIRSKAKKTSLKTRKTTQKEDKKGVKEKQNINKTLTNAQQNTEIDIDNDNEIDNEIIESKNEKIGFQILHVEDWLKKVKSKKEQVWREVFLVNKKVSTDAELKKYLIRFKDFCIEQGKDYREYGEFKSHFSNILPKWTQEIKNTERLKAGRR